MREPLVLDLVARDTFRPADVGWLTGKGVVLAGTFSGEPDTPIMQVRAVEHVPAGQRGRFVEVRVERPKLTR